MFTNVMKTDVTNGLKPGIARAEAEVQTGLRFGANTAGGEVVAARDAMAASLQRARENGAKQVEAAEILIAAMEKVLANYASADTASAGQIATVEKTLLDAITAAEKVMLPPTGSVPQ
ncbi:hypothetical protein AB0B66_18785 [Catellatospora sp. NPDC049111]|uniref:hypothetical protein n=1 Tax=Catellatospora sp. NPDC049111 TaxID=3155271 RepID=UPI0033D58A70